MKLTSKPDRSDLAMFLRMESEGGLVHIGAHPVLYGVRIVGGFTDDCGWEINWCIGGAEEPNHAGHFWSAYTAIYLLLRRRAEDRFCFEDIPSVSDIKPCWKDPAFQQRLTDLLLEDPRVTVAG